MLAEISVVTLEVGFFVDSFLLIRSADDEQKASALSPLRTSALPALPVAGSCMSEWLLCFLSLSPISSQELRLGSRLEFRETHSKFSFVQGRPKVPPGEELKISHAWSTSVQSTSTGAFFLRLEFLLFSSIPLFFIFAVWPLLIRRRLGDTHRLFFTFAF